MPGSHHARLRLSHDTFPKLIYWRLIETLSFLLQRPRQYSHLASCFQRFTSFDEYSILSSYSSSHHDCCRGGQAKSAGAGNSQHRNANLKGEGKHELYSVVLCSLLRKRTTMPLDDGTEPAGIRQTTHILKPKEMSFRISVAYSQLLQLTQLALSRKTIQELNSVMKNEKRNVTWL